MSLYIGLVHYPVYNKNDEIITTAITNFDIHDIARTARTYNTAGYFIIHPLENQQMLANEIIDDIYLSSFQYNCWGLEDKLILMHKYAEFLITIKQKPRAISILTHAL
jgi:hypothetical protein